MFRSALLAFGLVIALFACATTAEEADSNAPQTCYLISDSKERVRLGEVPMGRQLKRCLRRSGFGGGWHLIVERASSDRIDPALNQTQATLIQSQDFYITPGDEIVWNVYLNRLRYMRGGGRDCTAVR